MTTNTNFRISCFLLLRIVNKTFGISVVILFQRELMILNDTFRAKLWLTSDFQQLNVSFVSWIYTIFTKIFALNRWSLGA